MYRGKFLHSAAKSKKRKRPVLLIACIVLVVLVTAGSTLAYIMTSTNQVENTFTPANVTVSIDETKTANTKSNITITNNKTDRAVTAYVRATLEIYWTDTIDGQSVVIAPPAGAAVSVGNVLSGWFQVGEIYYYTAPVAPGASTTAMLGTITVTVPDGSTAQCHVDIHAEGIQAEPSSAVESAWMDVDVDQSGHLAPHR